MEFDFPKKEGTGIAKLIPNVSPECRDIIIKMLNYNYDNRMSAGQALKTNYFKELREADRAATFTDSLPQAHLSGMVRLTNRGVDSLSHNSKSVFDGSISKISDNASEGSYNPADPTKKAAKKLKAHAYKLHVDKKAPGLMPPDMKIENSKTQTFHSEVEDNYGSGGAQSSGAPSIIGGISGGMSVGGGPDGHGQAGLPPIFLPTKKGGKLKGVGHSHSTMSGTGIAAQTLSAFNTTKKNFPQLGKLKKTNPQQHQYVSPYSIKSI